jgi:hypothetical protein
MQARNRDDFSATVVRNLGHRAGYVCSNPRCRRPTAGPHSDPTKAVITGEACHIRAASPLGPRYEPSQSPDERKSITNGIWLCAVCSKRVDTDWQGVLAEELLKWKAEHEQWIASEGMIPALPEISLVTLQGLRTHPTLGPISSEGMVILREQELTIRNPNRVELVNFQMVMRLPEAILTYGHHRKNAGTHLVANPIRPQWTALSVQQGGKVISSPPEPTPNHSLEVPRLSSEETCTIAFYTLPHYTVMIGKDQTSPPVPAERPDSCFPETHVSFYLEGTYQFLLRGEYVTAEFFVPLRYSFEERRVQSRPCQHSSEGWDVKPIFSFPGIQLQG